MSKEKKIWRGTKCCDICRASESDFWVDGKTKLGPWGFMCSSCFREYGKGVAPGVGQKYDGKTLEKIGG